MRVFRRVVDDDYRQAMESDPESLRIFEAMAATFASLASRIHRTHQAGFFLRSAYQSGDPASSFNNATFTAQVNRATNCETEVTVAAGALQIEDVVYLPPEPGAKAVATPGGRRYRNAEAVTFVRGASAVPDVVFVADNAGYSSNLEYLLDSATGFIEEGRLTLRDQSKSRANINASIIDVDAVNQQVTFEDTGIGDTLTRVDEGLYIRINQSGNLENQGVLLRILGYDGGEENPAGSNIFPNRVTAAIVAVPGRPDPIFWPELVEGEDRITGSDATFDGTTYDPGITARVFDGLTDRIDYPGIANLIDGVPWTMSFEVNPSNFTTEGRIWSSRLGASSGSSFVSILASGQIRVFGNAATTDLIVESNETIALDTIQHVIITSDGSGLAAGTRIYIDGVEATYATAIDAVGALQNTDFGWHLGGRFINDTVNFAGELHSFRIFPIEFDAAQIAEELSTQWNPVVESGTLTWALLDWKDLEFTLTDITVPTGGTDNELFALGDGRGIYQQASESDDAFRQRAARLPDTVSPGAIRRAMNRGLQPYNYFGQAVDLGDSDFEGLFWDVDALDYFTVAGDPVYPGGTEEANLGHNDFTVVATTNQTLSGTGAVVDGVTLAAFDLIVLTGQTNPVENGAWNVLAGAWTRSSRWGFPIGAPVNAAPFQARILNGTTYAGTVWGVPATLAGSDVIGVDALTIVQLEDTFPTSVYPEPVDRHLLSIQEAFGWGFIFLPAIGEGEFGFSYDEGPLVEFDGVFYGNAWDSAFFDGFPIEGEQAYASIASSINNIKLGGVGITYIRSNDLNSFC